MVWTDWMHGGILCILTVLDTSLTRRHSTRRLDYHFLDQIRLSQAAAQDFRCVEILGPGG